MDNESFIYKGKHFRKGDTVKYSPSKEGKLTKIGPRNIVILRDDNHKERRLPIQKFLKFNFESV